ncbi:NAD(P)-binding domain-containing protein [Goodfellowiella coeruleoviolacea]|uniref:Flavoprotein CzcO associated with the cation diffusion facilitator CzcD n=1 Tax=Goodfellowiella coeruleoviolacea TaxID=334858 RepID=A0AAE3GBT3_9PSEU|nr:NAD(P)-binding domain-containing protein [Goodfellowiella coeruleoviolacea]MCP2163273.1 putative flavoprotein CzcO associated with the cation diffusion facilitator CzcD [Goodfellowiella coeruleoviolacea]
MRETNTPLLVIGAGPYGLALSAQCRHDGIDHILLGRPMSLWHDHMPRGMFLRSRCDWHLDPFEVYTLDRYAQEHGLTGRDLDPIPLSRYLDYAAWFQDRREVVAHPRQVVRLDTRGPDATGFVAELDTGEVIVADQVVVATGLGSCAHVPPELAAVLPDGSYRHSQDVVDLAALAGRSCLIVGGRQSAFEWAALAAEEGAAEVHVCHRHATPGFAPADWTWVNPLLDRFVTERSWYRELSTADRAEITQRMWRIGRLQLEEWLAPRIDRDNVRLWPHTRVVSGQRTGDGRVRVTLDSGDALTVDTVVLATGYRMDVARLPFLAAGGLLRELATDDGFPVLDENFRSSVAGLYFTSRFAVRDFGHFFDFTAAARVSARVISESVRAAGSGTA